MLQQAAWSVSSTRVRCGTVCDRRPRCARCSSAETPSWSCATPVPVRAGQATIHHSHVLHGSDRNRSDRWRRAVVLNYMGPDVRVADGSRPLLRGVPPLAEGALVEGPDFPIVFGA